MNFRNKKNEFFEFLSKDCFLALDQNNFLWPGNENQLLVVIKSLPFCKSTNQLLSFITFWNNNFLLADPENFRFFEALKEIHYNKITVSALFSYLKVKYQQNNMSLDYTIWFEVVPLLVNCSISDVVFHFLVEMEIPYFLKITQSENEFMKAVLLHFYSITVPYNYSWDLHGFSNLLKFLKVEETTRNSLIKKTMNQKNFDDIQNFLSKYTFNFK